MPVYEVYTTAFVLGDKDGRVRLYDNPNERFWSVEGGFLIFRHDDGHITTVFTSCINGAKYSFLGRFQGQEGWNVHFLKEL